MKDINTRLNKFITKVLVDQGYDKHATAYVLGEYDLFSYLLEDRIRVIESQINDITKVMEI
jgi:hypothetical protein